jgi:hypothetical protein
MATCKAIGKALLLALKPLSKTADIWDIKDIINFLILAAYGGGAKLTQPIFSLEWHIVYLAFIPALLLLIAAIKLQKSNDDFQSNMPDITFLDGMIASGTIFFRMDVFH